MWDMLGRAKWLVLASHISQFAVGKFVFRDEWTKHKDLDQYEAKWLYVDALLKVCI